MWEVPYLADDSILAHRSDAQRSVEIGQESDIVADVS